VSLGRYLRVWEVVELNDLCSKIVGGGTPNSKIDDYWKNGTIYWATVKDMDNSKYLSKTQDTITDLGLKNSSANLIPANSIITATRMGLGRFFINTVDMAINQDLKALIIKERYDKNFIFWSLVSKSDFILSLGTGTTVKGIRLEEFKTIKFTIPPLREQKQIADILSTADEKLEVLRAKKEKYETLKKGLLQKLLSGEVRV
jgi:type I restriction enzyme S subunit